jgi:hypothetical protein
MPALDKLNAPVFYHRYIQHVKYNNLLPALREHVDEVQSVLESINKEKWDHAYQPGKWTVKEMVQHLIDTERIFSYRALRIARMDPTPLPGFDENLFALNAKANRRQPSELKEEYLYVRRSALLLFQSFDDEQQNAVGMSNEQPISVEAIGYIIPGHALHHVSILKERYGI